MNTPTKTRIEKKAAELAIEEIKIKGGLRFADPEAFIEKINKYFPELKAKLQPVKGSLMNSREIVLTGVGQ